MACALALLLPLPACGSAGSDDDRRLVVLAASSLTAPFEEIADEFEAEHPGVEVRLSFAGSSDLVAQVREGAEADVLATADTRTMGEARDAGLAADAPSIFAANTLVIAVPPGNPAGVRDLADLSRPGLDLVRCAPEVPCGAAADRVADAAGVRLAPVSEEQSVTDVLAKVRAGEADAGLVYVTDVRAADGEVDAVAIPEAAAAVNHYPIAALEGSERPDLARAFVDLVLGVVGRRTLADHGFGPPPSPGAAASPGAAP